MNFFLCVTHAPRNILEKWACPNSDESSFMILVVAESSTKTDLVILLQLLEICMLGDLLILKEIN